MTTPRTRQDDDEPTPVQIGKRSIPEAPSGLWRLTPRNLLGAAVTAQDEKED